MAKFHTFHFHADEAEIEGAPQVPPALGGTIRALSLGEQPLEATKLMENWDDETAARHFLSSFLGGSNYEAIRQITRPERPEIMPDFKVESTQDPAFTDTRTVKFSQTSQAVPIFGAEAVVEIDENDRRLVSFDAQLAEAPDVSPLASISPREGLAAISAYTEVEVDAFQQVAAPETYYFLDDQTDTWHLVFYYKSVPAVPTEQKEGLKEGHGHGPSPRAFQPRYDFLVDAHSAEVVFYFSAQPMIDVPTPCSGIDDEGVNRTFFGLNNGAGFDMRDPLRNIETLDFQLGDLNSTPVPNSPIHNQGANFGSTNPAGVSAHFYATQVFDFYNNVLKRNGVDDKGMKLLSLVNVTYPARETPPDWHNAVWWDNKMWYGQVQNAQGQLESFARFFDVIAHELTHGVTETTSDLVYRNQSGALNESFSDIFGIIIKNWYPNQPNPLASWDWEIGAGLGRNGLPLRDMRDPTRTGDPAHMNDYLNTVSDNGGVHTNSNIHNKAAYEVLVSTDASGAPVFSVEEVSILYYLTLTRLSRMAKFSDCLRILQSVTATYFSGNPQVQVEKKQAIIDAYKAVGIT